MGPPVQLEPRQAVEFAIRALQEAARSPNWLPRRIAHADWGTAPAKRMVASAKLRDGAYIAHAPVPVGTIGGLLERMRLTPEPRQTTLIGFDFAIGLPRAYARQVGIDRFASWFRSLEGDVPGIKAEFHRKLGLTAAGVLRRCDRAHCARASASEMFWALGAKAVGKATLSGWRDTLYPAFAETGRAYSLWPFDRRLVELLASSDAVIVETYPTDAYLQLGLTVAGTSASKTRQADRRTDAARLLQVCAECAVLPDEALTRQVLDGFGLAASGEDAFDALIGLLAMISTVRRAPEPPLPDDPCVASVEGWMFGQHPVCP